MLSYDVIYYEKFKKKSHPANREGSFKVGGADQEDKSCIAIMGKVQCNERCELKQHLINQSQLYCGYVHKYAAKTQEG